MTSPQLSIAVRKQLRGFDSEQIEDARKSLVALAKASLDPKVRLDAAKYIDQVTREDEDNYFTGNTEAIAYIANLPLEDRTSAAMKLFAHGGISRKDLETLLSTIKTDQAARIADLNNSLRLLENENKLLTDQILKPTAPRIDLTAQHADSEPAPVATFVQPNDASARDAGASSDETSDTGQGVSPDDAQ